MASVGPLLVCGSVEVGQDVRSALLQRSPERDEFGQRGGDPVAEGVDQRGHRGSALRGVGVAVGVDHALVDAPGRLDLDVGVDRDQGVDARALLVGEQVGAGAGGSA
jgi:hypothetical protein